MYLGSDLWLTPCKSNLHAAGNHEYEPSVYPGARQSVSTTGRSQSDALSRPSPVRSLPPASRSRWTGGGGGWAASSSSGCDGRSSARTCTSRARPTAARPGSVSVRGSPSKICRDASGARQPVADGGAAGRRYGRTRRQGCGYDACPEDKLGHRWRVAHIARDHTSAGFDPIRIQENGMGKPPTNKPVPVILPTGSGSVFRLHTPALRG